MDKPTTSHHNDNGPEVKETDESDQEDYSASVNAIIQRRASTRKSKRRSRRRSSSPFASEAVPSNEELRRRSSVYTTSSGETAITIEENLNNEATQDEIYEMIKLHKEVLSNVKFQPWSMRKKLKLIRQARAYIKKHEGELQVRLAQSHSTKDMVARYKIYLAKKWQKWKSEIINYSLWLIPWELKIKEIESHFGSVVASYFIFLRWLFWVNIVIAVVLISFVTIPEIITADPQAVKERKFVLEEEKYNATNFLTLWDFEGAFKYSPIFYGWYTFRDNNGSAILGDGTEQGSGYRLPFAYFVTGLLVYAYSFFAILRKMAENSRASRLSEKDDECNFSVKLFTAWDFTIGNPETAHNRVASIVMGFKEALLEEAEKKREPKNWKIICIRIMVNIFVIGMLSCSAWVVIFVVKRSNEPEAQSTLWRRNESTLVITLISNTFPFVFELLGILEQYHPRKQLRIQLARIMVLNLLNLYSLVFSTLSKISGMALLYYLIEETNSTGGLSLTSSTDINSTCICTESTVLERNKFSLIESANLLAEFNGSSNSNVNNILLTNDTMDGFNASVVQTLSDVVENFTNQLTNLIPESFTEASTTWQNDSNIMSTTDVLFNDSFTKIVSENLTDVFTYDYTENITGVLFDDSYTKIVSENLTDVFTYDYTENITESFSVWEDNIKYFDNYTESTINSTEITEISASVLEEDNRANAFVDYLSYVLGSLGVFLRSDNTENVTYEIENATLQYNETFETYSSSDVLENVFLRFELSSVENATLYSTQDILKDFEVTTLSSAVESIDTIFTTDQTSFEYSPSNSTTISSTAIAKYGTTICTCSTQSEISSTVQTFLATNTSLSPAVKKQLEEYWKSSDYEKKSKIRSLCWESMFGQELIKLTIMDLLGTVGVAFGLDFFRGIFVRVMNKCWCWDLEKKFPQYGDFKVAENILHLVNNQGMVWMGMFFSPGLVVLNVVKLYIMMYFRAWVVLTCNVPPTVIFRASRSNNFYYALLLMMLFLCVLPVSYAIVWVEPSLHCGPFSGYAKIFHIFTKSLRAQIPPSFHWILEYIASPGIVIPLLLLLILIIYYLTSLTSALKEANDDLKTQLKQERTEERRKMFKLATKRKRATTLGESNDLSANTPFAKWKKILGDLPTGKSQDDTHDTPKQESEKSIVEEKKIPENKSKVFFSKLIKKALGKSSTSDEDQDNTDNEQHDSLPYDINKSTLHTSVNRSVSNNSFELQSLVNKVWSSRNREKLGDANEKNIAVDEKPANDENSAAVSTKPKRLQQENTEIVTENEKMHSIDSDASSLWSENLPTIKISKTESDENIINTCKYDCVSDVSKKDTETIEGEDQNEFNTGVISGNTCNKTRHFQPKIKCVLKKQSTEIDEDIIVHFGADVEKIKQENEIVKVFVEQTMEDDISSTNKQDFTREEILSEKSLSDGTEEKEDTSGTTSSMQTVFNVSSESNNDETFEQ